MSTGFTRPPPWTTDGGTVQSNIRIRSDSGSHSNGCGRIESSCCGSSAGLQVNARPPIVLHDVHPHIETVISQSPRRNLLINVPSGKSCDIFTTIVAADSGKFPVAPVTDTTSPLFTLHVEGPIFWGRRACRLPQHCKNPLCLHCPRSKPHSSR